MSSRREHIWSVFSLADKRGFVAFSGNHLSLPLWSSLDFDFNVCTKDREESKLLFPIIKKKLTSCTTAGSQPCAALVSGDDTVYAAGRLALLCDGYC